jgi:hypothetical protein
MAKRHFPPSNWYTGKPTDLPKMSQQAISIAALARVRALGGDAERAYGHVGIEPQQASKQHHRSGGGPRLGVAGGLELLRLLPTFRVGDAEQLR